MKTDFKEILEKEKNKQKKIKQWHPMTRVIVFKNKKKYNRKDNRKYDCFI